MRRRFTLKRESLPKRAYDMFARVDRTLLTEQNLTNLSAAVINIRVASDKAAAMVDHINSLVDTNSRPISSTLTNLVYFSEQMRGLAEEMEEAVATNKMELSAALKSIKSISANLFRRAFWRQTNLFLQPPQVRLDAAIMGRSFNRLSSAFTG